MKDTIIIAGAGPAGLTAGIYGLRSGLDVHIVEQISPGGNMALAPKIDNYPGYPEGISGLDLSQAMEKQFRNLGGTIINGEVTSVDFQKGNKNIYLQNDQVLEAPVFIIATGTRRRRLGVPGEEKLIGKGVSYCAVCDGIFFKGKKVAVIGGGNSALEEAIYLSRLVSRCYLVHRRFSFRAMARIQEELIKHPEIEQTLGMVVEEIWGEKKVEGIKLKNLADGTSRLVEVEGVFISIGQSPNTEFLKEKLIRDESGYIVTDEKMQTSEPGVFACGDVRRKNLYQIITACGDAAVATYFAEKYLKEIGR